ncbi:MAG: DNA replication/repair protein RecF [Thiotrichales bacterium]
MYVVRTRIENLRRIVLGELDLCPGLNYLSGANASGKTTILEAIEILGRARSFRTHQQRELIRFGCKSMSVFGEVDRDGVRDKIGVERSVTKISAKHNHEPVRKLSLLSRLLPTLLFDPSSLGLVSGPPEVRRKHLDWGCFYFKPEFFSYWGEYKRGLSQRNALLRNGGSDREISVWSSVLANSAKEITRIRREYIRQLGALMSEVIDKMSVRESSALEIMQGWSVDRDLGVLLDAEIEGDRKIGFTRFGPHRADLIIKQDGLPATTNSRGQQRQLVVVWLLAQAKLFAYDQGYWPVLLLDDIESEFDSERFKQVMSYLASFPAQILLTSTRERSEWLDEFRNVKMFHVEQGRVSEVIY